MEYDFRKIEAKWQKFWQENKIYKVEIDYNRPKYYVLDMFPYPSGAGLHVGHPLGYIASDIYSRYKRLNGFNVLHPMGYDAFGLPAEQYAIQTGKHPAITTEANIKKYREQLDKIGFSYDWDREVKTCDPDYYHWTQWVFIKMFKHWFNKKTKKAEPISLLIKEFERNGNINIDAHCSETELFSAEEWQRKTEQQQQQILLNYRLAYLADTMVNWCPELGTVLANDEVVNGVSVRGGFPVEQKNMKQWCLRISAYAQRLLDDLDELDWSDSLKEIQKNWIGRSEGAELVFKIKDSDTDIVVFTTRPDTIFGATFMVLAPESEYVQSLTTKEYQLAVDEYIKATKKRTERERIAEVKNISGQFTGSYAVNPFTNKNIPVYISDYVLAGYGTGAIMAVPGHDSRDFKFARHFNLQITQVVVAKGEKPSDTDTWQDSYDGKNGIIINSCFINGLTVENAIIKITEEIEKRGIGKRKINYKLRDAIFSRQRYWGEPFPIYYKNGMPYTIDEDELPLRLPEIDKFLPTEDGLPPLGRAKNWTTKDGLPLELSTMPGFAGSSAYYYRYMDPHNNKQLVSKQANEYWQDVDLYIGGTEHATGHLIYSRFWNKFLYDIGVICKKEPFRKLVNQGMIQGRSNFVYRIAGSNIFVSKKYYDDFNRGKTDNNELEKIIKNKLNIDIKCFLNNNIYVINKLHVDINFVRNDILDTEAFKKSRKEYHDAVFVLEDNNSYVCGWEIEKMSKSKYNVVNPDDIIEKYGADTLRMYEMFLGPLEQSKPWDTNGIDGVFKFFRKTWKLFYNEKGIKNISEEEPDKKELKILHKTIKKIRYDIENFSFNTSVSAFMICVNELTNLKCNKRQILEPFTIILSPFAPHISEELWLILGNKPSIFNAEFPQYDEKYLIEDTVKYPVSFNGKMRFTIELPADISKEDAEKAVIEHESSIKWMSGKTPKKIIFVPKKIINIVI